MDAYILGVHTGHDASACLFKGQNLVAFCKEERLTRKKNDGGFFHLASIDEVLAIAGITRQQVDIVAMTRMKLPVTCYRRTSRPTLDFSRRLFGSKRDRLLIGEMIKQQCTDTEQLIDFDRLRKELGVGKNTKILFCNHHYAHILGAFKYTDWVSDALYLSCDGGGDAAQYSAYHCQNGELRCLFGGDETLLERQQNAGASVGLAYAYMTQALGFTPNRHEGKITGLAAFGKAIAADDIVSRFRISESGEVVSDFPHPNDLRDFIFAVAENLSREDAAASIQQALEQIVLQWIRRLRELAPSRYIGLSGGVFSNVRLNQLVAELDGIEEVFVFPVMTDEGLSIGAAVDALMRSEICSLKRERLEQLYYGRPYDGEALLAAAREGGFVIDPDDPVNNTAQRLANGQVGAIFYDAMEMGPRALGARSILASPARREVNDSINQRLQRTEFMPFAPYVLDKDAEKVFEINVGNRYACQFMTITTMVKEEFQPKIPAVVHVDGTARPQIISRNQNPLYHDILKAFTGITGLPCLVNTSFNAHEEPIINTPHEALQALKDNRVDFLVCELGIVRLGIVQQG